MEEPFVANGKNGQLTVYPRKVVIGRKGAMSKLTQGFTKGEKTINITSISAVQLKRAGALTNGYIQFSLSGGGESTKGLMDAVKDENSIMFTSKQMPDFERAKDLIEQYQEAPQERQVQEQPDSGLDDLERLAGLRDKGVITEEEFQAKKKSILGM